MQVYSKRTQTQTQVWGVADACRGLGKNATCVNCIRWRTFSSAAMLTVLHHVLLASVCQ